MSFGIPVRNGLSIGLLASTFLTSGSARLIPGLTLNFLTGDPLDSRITFTRSTTATFVGSNGLIQSAAINAPRFDFNPATLAPLGLLIEEARTNVVYNSTNVLQGNWEQALYNGGGVNFYTASSVTTPTPGPGDSSYLIATSTPGNIAARQNGVSLPNGTTWTVSAYVYMPTQANVSSWRFDVSFNGDYVPGSNITLFDQWVRVSHTATLTGDRTLIDYLVLRTDGANPVENMYFYMTNMQAEQGAFITSYIPTATSTVTRAADIAVMTGTNFSSWYNASEGTFVSSFEASPNTFTTYVAASNGVVAQNSMHMDNDGSGNMRVAYYSGSSAVALLSLGAVGTLGAVNTLATAYKVNDFAASRNGGAVVTDTLGVVPAGVTQLNIGADPSGAAVNVSNTHIRSITYYRSRLTNAQLQTLSA
jgi:hypothetical protein